MHPGRTSTPGSPPAVIKRRPPIVFPEHPGVPIIEHCCGIVCVCDGVGDDHSRHRYFVSHHVGHDRETIILGASREAG